MRTILVLAALSSGVLAIRESMARGNGEILIYERRPSDGHKFVLRFSPRLGMLSATDLTSAAGVNSLSSGYDMRIARNSLGDAWIGYAPLSDTKLVRLDTNASYLAKIELGWNPVNVTFSPLGSLFVLNRIPLSSPGPVQRVETNGTVAWTSIAASSSYNFVNPTELTWTSLGELWMGGTVQGAPTSFSTAPMLKRIEPANGHVMQTFYPPANGALVFPPQTTQFGQLAGSIDGTLWLSTVSPNTGSYIYRTNGEAVLNAVPIPGEAHLRPMKVDGRGDVWTASEESAAGEYASHLFKSGVSSGVSGIVLDQIDFGGIVIGYALGTSGRDLFAIVTGVLPPTLPPYPFYFVRVNLLTKAMSRYRLDPVWEDHAFPWGDPTGFVLANVIQRNLDSDGDGFPNGVETGAISDPFDPKSRPSGPRVDLWFAPGTNALRLRYVDPEGLLDPVVGIDPTSLSLTASGIGEIFPVLLNFLSSVAFSVDGTEATLEFDLLPIPSFLKIQLDAKVRDRSGAESWDWQVTPPGILNGP